MSFIIAFCRDERTLALFGLIVVDLVVGLIAAMRTRTFNPHQVGNWYFTNVLPFCLGYLLVYAVSLLGIALYLGQIWGEVAATVGIGPAVVNLFASIGRNLALIRFAPEDKVQAP